MKKFAIAAAAAAILTSCTGSAPKSLILYYTQTGTTEALVKELQKQTGADVERFDVEEVYDGDYASSIERVMAERQIGFLPTLVPIKSDLSKYDTIFLAYPIWFGTCAMPVKALIKEVNLDGKKIIPICTFGSLGLEASTDYLRSELPNSEVADGFGIRTARIQYAAEELNRFLIENGYKEGTVDPLPDYSEQALVLPDEQVIYDDATAGYPYPIGTPISVASRTVPGGTDYLFIVATTSMDGTPGEGKVFVSTREGRNPEFTKVIR